MDSDSIMLHMDENWDWRWYIVNDRGHIIAVSSDAYFSDAEARQAVDEFRAQLLAA